MPHKFYSMLIVSATVEKNKYLNMRILFKK